MMLDPAYTCKVHVKLYPRQIMQFIQKYPPIYPLLPLSRLIVVQASCLGTFQGGFMWSGCRLGNPAGGVHGAESRFGDDTALEL